MAVGLVAQGRATFGFSASRTVVFLIRMTGCLFSDVTQPLTQTSMTQYLTRTLRHVALGLLSCFLAAGLHAQTVGGAVGPAGAAVGPVGAAAAPAVGPAEASATLADMLGQGASNTAQESAAQSLLDEAAPSDTRQAINPATRRSQFQIFVQEATGQNLPIYGASLFGSPSTYAPISNIAPPANYVLGPGDQIQLQLWGATSLSINLTVDRNGQIMVPRVGPLAAAGLRVEQLEPALKTHIGKVLTNFDLAASVSRLRSIQVYVVGQAQRPGTYTLSSLSTLVNALFASGGPNPNGSMRNIQLKRSGQTVTTIDLYDFIARGDQSKDVGLLPGDDIVIPPVGPQVAVHGAFDHAAIYELRDANTTIADILAPGGGVHTLTSTQMALLERVNPGQTPARQVTQISLDEAGLKKPLRAGDVLTLLGISPAFANSVTLQGSVAAPLRYPWFEGMRLLDLIPERDALISSDYYRRKNLLVQTIEASRETVANTRYQVRNLFDAIHWDYAVIQRLDRTTLTNQLIPFNLGQLVLNGDMSQNLVLQPGDVVTVFSQKDIRVPESKRSRLVRVEGEVAAPGVYEAMPGETLPQLLRRIGGLTEQAYVFGTEFTREEVRRQQQANLDRLISQLESSLTRQSGETVANLDAERAAQAAALVQMQRQSQVQQLNRLRSLRSNGRVALELDPRDATFASLPPVPLEDGDRIIVPAVPSFVAAFGAVNNENVFIYRPGRNVGEVLRLAGLTEDAESAQAFLLRADGTVVARRDRGGFLGGGSFDSLDLMPGDTVVVPYKVDRESRWSAITRGLKDWTQILSNLGLGVAAWRSL